jgi:hypothetical protein
MKAKEEDEEERERREREKQELKYLHPCCVFPIPYLVVLCNVRRSETEIEEFYRLAESGFIYFWLTSVESGVGSLQAPTCFPILYRHQASDVPYINIVLSSLVLYLTLFMCILSPQ